MTFAGTANPEVASLEGPRVFVLRLQGRQEGVQVGSQGHLYGPLPHHYPNQFVKPSPLPSKPVCQLWAPHAGRRESPTNLSATGFYRMQRQWGRSKKGTVATGTWAGHPLRGRAQAESRLSCPASKSQLPAPLPLPVAATPSPVSTCHSEEGDSVVSVHPC